jgi:hypothetical protein
MIDLEQTIQAQYANSPILLQLIQNMNSYIDPSANWTLFFNQVQNVLTAQGYGLDVWGRIVGVSRTVPIPAGNSSFYFRESGVGTPMGPGGAAPLYDGSKGTTLYRLGDTAYRMLVLTKALANISFASCPAINQLLQNLFGVGAAFCSDLGNMQMQVTFTNLSLLDYYILINSKVLPRPAGVMAFLYNGYVPGKTFMFRESGAGTPFGTGVLFSGQYNPVAI